MKLPSNPTISGISADLLRLIGKITQQVNGLSEGTENAYHNGYWFLDMADDYIIDDSAKGLVLKAADGNYWRVQVDNAGALTTTNLGTTKP